MVRWFWKWKKRILRVFGSSFWVATIKLAFTFRIPCYIDSNASDSVVASNRSKSFKSRSSYVGGKSSSRYGCMQTSYDGGRSFRGRVSNVACSLYWTSFDLSRSQKSRTQNHMTLVKRSERSIPNRKWPDGSSGGSQSVVCRKYCFRQPHTAKWLLEKHSWIVPQSVPTSRMTHFPASGKNACEQWQRIAWLSLR